MLVIILLIHLECIRIYVYSLMTDRTVVQNPQCASPIRSRRFFTLNNIKYQFIQVRQNKEFLNFMCMSSNDLTTINLHQSPTNPEISTCPRRVRFLDTPERNRFQFDVILRGPSESTMDLMLIGQVSQMWRWMGFLECFMAQHSMTDHLDIVEGFGVLANDVCIYRTKFCKIIQCFTYP